MKKTLLTLSITAISTLVLAQTDVTTVNETFERGVSSLWQILDEDNHQWMVRSGKLQIQVQPVNIWADMSEKANNLFVYPLEASSYNTEVTVELNPINPYEQAGIGVYWNADNYIKISNELFEERHSIVFVTEKAGLPSVNKRLDLDTNKAIFKLEKNEHTVTAYYKLTNNAVWELVMAVPVLEGKEQGVALYAFSGNPNKPQWAKFDNFKIN